MVRPEEEVGGGGVDAVEEQHVALLLGDVAALAVEQPVAAERGRQLLLTRRIGQQVAGDLLEAMKRSKGRSSLK